MGEIIGFIIWAGVGCFIIGIGISAFFRKKAVGFWANIEVQSVNNIKNYNYTMGKLFITYGVIFVLLGLPLLSAQNSPYILLSVLGIMVETIATMIIYTLIISKKYISKLEATQTSDSFFSESNVTYVKKSIQELKAGKGTAHELIEVEDE